MHTFRRIKPTEIYQPQRTFFSKFLERRLRAIIFHLLSEPSALPSQRQPSIFVERSALDPLATQSNLVRGDSVNKENISHPIAYRDNVIHFGEQAACYAVPLLDQIAHS